MNLRNDAGFLKLLHVNGPFDIVGDVHGCFEELLTLLHRLEYVVTFDKDTESYNVSHPRNHNLIFVGDLVDRGPNSPEVLRLVMDMAAQGIGYCVSGNHDDKLHRKLIGKNVHVRHGLEITMQQLSKYDDRFIGRVRKFLGSLPHHLILDEGKLVVAHAGLTDELHGKQGNSVRSLCLYGPTTGALDERGLPVRLDWAADYAGQAIVVYGHTPVQEPRWKNNTINIDTGCVFGGKLTALTYPEHTITSVDALETYANPMRPFLNKEVNT